MQVEVRLFANLQQGRFPQRKFDFPDDTAVREVLRHVGIEPREVAILLVNGQAAAVEHCLRAGDVLSLFSLVGGG